jgi:hypothetical protein
MVLKMKMLTSCSRGPFIMIDIDDNDPTTWLSRIREAIGDDAIEMILETKNGFHVVFLPKKMSQERHKSLNAVLSSDPGKGQDASVTKGKGSKLSVALPGEYRQTMKLESCIALVNVLAHHRGSQAVK